MTGLLTPASRKATRPRQYFLPGLFYLSAFVANPLQAGPWYGLETKTIRADVIVEVSLSGKGLPAKPVGFLKGRSLIASNPFTVDGRWPFSAQSRCWKVVREQKPVYALLFYRLDAKSTGSPIAGVENEAGFYTSLNPYYAELKQAISARLNDQQPWPDRMLALQTGHFCQSPPEQESK